jgi:c-di-GMP-binding flagellar brake protein YcgR
MVVTDHERRRYARSQRTLCAWLSACEDESALGTRTVDLSCGGACFSSLSPIDVGKKLLVSLEMPPATIECKAKVCWNNLSSNGLHYFGVKFLDVSEHERNLLERFMTETPPLNVAV